MRKAGEEGWRGGEERRLVRKAGGLARGGGGEDGESQKAGQRCEGFWPALLKPFVQNFFSSCADEADGQDVFFFVALLVWWR